MADLAVQAALVIGILSAFFVGPGLALTFLLLRKVRRRALRRSPIGIAMLRGPGHTVRAELEEVTNDLTYDVLALAVLPLVILALFLAQAHVRGWERQTLAIPVYVV